MPLRRRSLLGAGATLLVAPVAHAVQRTRAATTGASLHTLRFEWLEGGHGSGPHASVDLGTLAADRKAMRERRVVLRRRVAVRVDGPGPVVLLSAALLDEPAGCAVRVDGVVLSAVPRVIDPAHRVGAAVVHQLEFQIANDAPAGALSTRLQWFVDQT